MDYNKIRYNKNESISLVFYSKKGFSQHTIDDRYFEIIKEIFFKLFNPEEYKFKQITEAYERLTGKNIDDEYVRKIIGQLIGKGGFNFKKFTKAFKAGCIMYENYIITISFHKDDSNNEKKFKELKNILLQKLNDIICNNQYNHKKKF